MPRGISSRRRVRTIRHRAILEALDPRHHDALHVMLRGGARLTHVHRWLVALGCMTSLAALCRYRQQLAADDRRRDEEQSELEDAAFGAVMDALFAREQLRDPSHARDRRRFAETLLAFGELLLFESLCCLPAPSGHASMRRLNRYGAALTVLVDARIRFEQARPTDDRAAGPSTSTTLGMN